MPLTHKAAQRWDFPVREGEVRFIAKDGIRTTVVDAPEDWHAKYAPMMADPEVYEVYVAEKGAAHVENG